MSPRPPRLPLLLLPLAAALPLAGCATQARLRDAAQTGNLTLAEKQIANGAQANAPGPGGNTPLHFLAARELSSLAFSNRGPDWLDPKTLGRSGHAADELLLLNLLLAHGADVNARNNAGETPLHVAARQNCPVFAVALLARGADPLAKNNAGQTPLEVAARAGFRSFLETLLRESRRMPAFDPRLARQYLEHWQDYAPRESSPAEKPE